MKNKLNNFRYKMQRWMIGRYGTDELSKALLWIGIVLILLSYFVKAVSARNLLCSLAWIAVIYAYFRVFSKNIIKRSKERDIYLRKTAKLRSSMSVYKKMWHDRKTHNYYKCPNCKTWVRVPKGRGKIAISCKKCREEFIKTT